MSPNELNKKTVAELKKMAQELNISGITSKSTKAQIIELISAAPKKAEIPSSTGTKSDSDSLNTGKAAQKDQTLTADSTPKRVASNNQSVPKTQPASNLNPKLAQNSSQQTQKISPINTQTNNKQQTSRNTPQNYNNQPRHNNNQQSQQQTNNYSNEATVEVTGVLEIMSDGTHGVLRSPRLIPTDKDTYISISQVKKLKLRKGDVINGVARLPKENERYFSLLWIKTVNGTPIDQLKDRPNFDDLKPVYPNKQMKLEIGAHPVANRIIDLMAPIGFGQRAMVVAPPKAGKTTLLKDIAKGINENHPDVQLIVVLIGERPEEVTDIERSVNGIVYASNFDDSPANQVSVAELSLERAKRIVESGKDVIILMDSLTRLARAYNVALPASGRTLSGGLDPVSLYPSKRFFGAARNFENGASLTIVATSLVETGSKMDDVIFEEFKGTGNMELKLDRKLANKRVFPAIDLLESGTRNEELLLSPEILQDSWKLRRMLESLGQDASEALIDRMKGTKTNEEFLRTIHQY